MTEQKPIIVQDQAKLSLAKIIQLVRSGIKHRLLRSMLTMSVILLAVAFFMVTLSENVIINAVAKGVKGEIATERNSIKLMNHLYTKPNSLKFSQKLSMLYASQGNLQEIADATGRNIDDITNIAKQANWEQSYFNFFRNMSVGNRKMLIGNKKGRQIFLLLSDEKVYADFQKNLEPLRALKLPTKEKEFKGLISNFNEYTTKLNSVLSAWHSNVDGLDAATKKLTLNAELNAWLCEADQGKLDAWIQVLKDHKLSTDNIDAQVVKKDMLKLRARNDVTETLLKPELKKEWQETYKTKENMAAMMNRLGDKNSTEIINKYAQHKYEAADLAAIADNVRYNKKLSALESDLSKHTAKKSGSVLSGRQTFLLFISFIVCMVGIANAMLMAITERFREIATMKCLGATDSFILIQFMMEAAMQGVVGGVLGMCIGFILGILKTAISYGLYPIFYFPLVALIICAVVSLLIGIVLAVLASLYPSWAASRMAPMEAMRIE